jgi:hypothetical protein
VEVKVKTDGSMQWAASYCSTPTLPFLLYYAPRVFLSFSLLVEPINRTQVGWGSLALLHFLFHVS